jgi:inner membrane protein
MDSLTQIALGAAVTALIAPARHRRAAMIAGGVLGTLPDLDVIPLTLSGADAISRITWHRGVSHSLPILAVTGWLLWLVLRRWWAPIREAPVRWMWAIQLALLTHPLLDAFHRLRNAAILALARVSGDGSQHLYHRSGLHRAAACRLRRRMVAARAEGGELVVACGCSVEHGLPGLVADGQGHRRACSAARSGRRRFARRAAFLGAHAIQHPSLARSGDDAGWISGRRAFACGGSATDRLSTPYERPRCAGGRGRISFGAAARLVHTRFLKAEQRDGRLVLSDLRMGVEPEYVFRYAVAESDGQGGWRKIAVEQLDWPSRDRLRLAGIWRRIWNEPNPDRLEPDRQAGICFNPARRGGWS